MVYTETLVRGKLSIRYCNTTAAIVNSTWVKAIKGKVSGELNSRAVVIILKQSSKNLFYLYNFVVQFVVLLCMDI